MTNKNSSFTKIKVIKKYYKGREKDFFFREQGIILKINATPIPQKKNFPENVANVYTL